MLLLTDMEKICEGGYKGWLDLATAQVLFGIAPTIYQLAT